jgi:hypothetical protein
MLEAARDLYALPIAEFTAARNALAKELKKAGSSDDAGVVAGLRKPRVGEHGLNLLARSSPELVRRFVDAVSGAQKAQAAAIGGDAGALRAATAELRQATAETTDAAVRALIDAGEGGEAHRDDIMTLLRDFVSNANAGPLVAGMVGGEALARSGELFPGAPEPPAAPKTKPAAPAKAQGPKRDAAAEKKAAAAAEALRRAERTGLEDAVRKADAVVDKAQAAVENAQRELLDRRAALKEAQAAAKAAAKALSDFDD